MKVDHLLEEIPKFPQLVESPCPVLSRAFCV